MLVLPSANSWDLLPTIPVLAHRPQRQRESPSALVPHVLGCAGALWHIPEVLKDWRKGIDTKGGDLKAKQDEARDLVARFFADGDVADNAAKAKAATSPKDAVVEPGLFDRVGQVLAVGGVEPCRLCLPAAVARLAARGEALPAREEVVGGGDAVLDRPRPSGVCGRRGEREAPPRGASATGPDATLVLLLGPEAMQLASHGMALSERRGLGVLHPRPMPPRLERCEVFGEAERALASLLGREPLDEL